MTLATCAKDVKFYKWPSITLIGVYETPEDCMCIKSLSWCNEGKQVVIVKSKGSPALITAPTKTEENIEPYLTIQKHSVTVATFCNTKQKLLALGNIDGEVCLYDIRNKRNVIDYCQLPTAIQNLEFSCDDTLLAAGCTNGQLFLYNYDKKPCASFMVPNSYSLSIVTYSKTTPNLLAAASKEGVLCVWDSETTDSKLISRDHSSIVTDVAFYSDFISSVGVDGKLISIDLRSNKHAQCYNLKTPLAGIAYQEHKYEMAISTCDGQLRSYDLRNMSTPQNTVVAYNTWIKKICFPFVVEEITKQEPRQASVYCKTHDLPRPNGVYDDPKPAAGDFNVFSESNTLFSNQFSCHSNKSVILQNDLPASVSAINVQDEKGTPELEEFTKVIEEKMTQVKLQFQEKLLQTFYSLRINASKKFIGVEERVAQSWVNFVEYLKQSGAQAGGAASKHPGKHYMASSIGTRDLSDEG